MRRYVLVPGIRKEPGKAGLAIALAAAFFVIGSKRPSKYPPAKPGALFE
jgi:hypothetical protein